MFFKFAPPLAAAWPRRRVPPQAEPRQSAPLSEPRLGLGLGLRLGLGLGLGLGLRLGLGLGLLRA